MSLTLVVMLYYINYLMTELPCVCVCLCVI